MDEQEQRKLIEDVDALYKSYSNSGFFKRNFKFDSFRKSFREILANHHATEEMLFKILLAHSIISKNSPPKYISFLESVSRPPSSASTYEKDKYIMPPSVHTFRLLSSIFHDGESDDVVRTVFYEAFSCISGKNKVTAFYPDVTPGPLWKEPGIPFLLESLIQLIAAERMKAFIAGDALRKVRCCWPRSATISIELARLALRELEKEPLFRNLPIQEMVDNIVKRATRIVTLSLEKARSCENFFEITDDAYKTYHPTASSDDIVVASNHKFVDFVKELRVYMDSTNTAILFEKYLASY